MKPLIFFVLFISTLANTNAQTKPFDYLTTLELGPQSSSLEQRISYVPDNTSVINERLEDLDKSDGFYAEECDGGVIKVLTTKIASNTNEVYVITYNLSCCCDYGFAIYNEQNPTDRIGFIPGNELFIPGNGYLYSINHIGTNYNVRKKYKFNGNSIIEIEQPFNYVGLKSKTLRPIKIFKEKELLTEVASLPANYDIEILIADEVYKNLHYLVRTNFGLVGWAELEVGQYESVDVEGLYYWGN